MLIVNSNENEPFILQFCYPGSEIDFLLDDTNEIKVRINKTNKAMGSLKFIWNVKHVALESNVKLFW